MYTKVDIRKHIIANTKCTFAYIYLYLDKQKMYILTIQQSFYRPLSQPTSLRVKELILPHRKLNFSSDVLSDLRTFQKVAFDFPISKGRKFSLGVLCFIYEKVGREPATPP